MIPLPSLEGRWHAPEPRAVFRLTGPDRIRFLNGQVSNNVSGPLEAEAIAACLCSLKGKVEALVWIHAEGETLVLDGELAQREAIHARLEKYLIADDCEIADATGEVRLIHHFAPDGPGIPSSRIGLAGRDLWLSAGEAIPFSETDRIAEDEWRLRNVLARIPESGSEINGETFPAELALDRWAVDFHKGCYLGQEIVSRIKSVGKIKRLLRVVEATRPLAPGESVVPVGLAEPGGKGGGAVTRPSLELGEGRHLSLAILPLAEPLSDAEAARPVAVG